MRQHPCIALLLTALCVADATGKAKADQPQLIGMIRDASISEISGAALSIRDPAHLYAINDSQNGALLHALSHDGGALGKVRINGATNQDWEDLSSFVLDEQPYLLIADTGDNGGLRKSLELIVVAEPSWPLPDAIDIAWRIRFRLPEGARDIEAVAVDAQAQSIYLIAKRHFPRVLYRLPLHPADTQIIHVAERIGTFSTLPPATSAEKSRDPKFGRFQGDITAFALDPQVHYALALSYRDLYFYPRREGESLLQSLARKPKRMRVPPMPQAEAIALDALHHKAIILSERLLAPIYQVDIPSD